MSGSGARRFRRGAQQPPDALCEHCAGNECADRTDDEHHDEKQVALVVFEWRAAGHQGQKSVVVTQTQDRISVIQV
jgi:hypothetical protein